MFNLINKAQQLVTKSNQSHLIRWVYDNNCPVTEEALYPDIMTNVSPDYQGMLRTMAQMKAYDFSALDEYLTDPRFPEAVELITDAAKGFKDLSQVGGKRAAFYRYLLKNNLL
ncbi:MAG: hypothetical protein WBB28_01790 [Crinalium sp.]